MKFPRIIVVIIMLCGLTAVLLGCASESDSAATENQVFTVQRGDITLEITGVGNLSLSRTENLAFEIAGTVEEVMVEEGDTVGEGQILARLDTARWQDELTALEKQLRGEKIDLLQVLINLSNAETELEEAIEPMY